MSSTTLLLFFLLLSLASSQPILTTSTGLQFVRTPSSRFRRIRDFSYPVRYARVSGMRMAYVDAGEGTSGTILLLHGEPDWGYLYRLMLPTLIQGGFRVVVPDYIGFGRSDKPISREAYSADSHIAWMADFLDQTRLRGAHLFAQDWGGLIGLTLAAENPDLFDRLILANTALPADDQIFRNPLFQDWVRLSQTASPFLPSQIIDMFSTRKLSKREKAAYDAPFPSELYLAGARQFPVIVPQNATSPGAERFGKARKALSQWKRPVLLQWGLKDFALDITFYEDFRKLIPGTEGEPHAQYPDADHFMQEDVGPSVAAAMVQWIKTY